MGRIVIDASPLLTWAGAAGMDGIGRTTRELIGALAGMQLPFEIVLFGQRMRGPTLSSLGLPFPTLQIPLPRLKWFEKLKTMLPVVEALGRYDLFHATSNFAYLHRPEKAIATIHDAMFLSHPERFLGHDLEARRIPPFARRCRAIITCSEASKNDIVRFIGISPDKIHVLAWGVRHDLFRPHSDLAALRSELAVRLGIRRPYFLQVSCNIGRKNSPLLFESYRSLLKHQPDNDLVMIWRKPPGEILKTHSDEQLEHRIHIIREVSDEDLRLLYCGATAMLFPSAYEGFGLPVLEAMACGTPVVTTRSSSLPEVGGTAAIYIDLEDPEALLKAMTDFEEGRYDRNELARKGVAQAAQFTWEKYARQIVSIYQMYIG